MYYQRAKELAESLEGHDSNLSILAFIYEQLCFHASGNNTIPLQNLTPLLKVSSLDTCTQVVLHQALGNVYRSAADWHESKAHFKVAIRLAKGSGDLVKTMECKAELGRAYRSSGCHSKALKHQKRFLQYACGRGDVFNVASACGYIGFTYYSMGEKYHNDSIQHLYCKLLLSKNELCDSGGYRWCLNNIGKLYLRLKDYNLCMRLFGESGEIAKEHGNSLGLGTAYGNMGSACRAVGKHNDAITYHKLYLEIAKKNSDTGGVAIMERELILDHLYLYRDETDREKKASFLTEARNYAFQALKTSLNVRSRLSKDDDVLKIGNFEHNQAKIFSLVLFIVIEQGQHEAGLVLSELGRAHALADRIKDKFDVDSSFLADVIGIIGSDNQIITSSLSALLKKVGRLLSGLDSHVLVYSVMENPLFEDAKETLLYTWHVQQDGQDSEVQVHFKQSVINLTGSDKDQSGVEGYLSGLRREVELTEVQLITSTEDSLESKSSSISRDIIRRKNLAPKKDNQPKRDRLEELYDLLIKPMSQHIFSCKQQGVRLIIIPHSFLFGIPFCALKSRGNFLIEQCILCVSFSLYVLDIGLQREGEWYDQSFSKKDIRLLAVGNPKMPLDDISQLPGAEREVKLIEPLFNTTKLLCGKLATKKVVCESFSEHSVIHLATHAIIEASLQDHLAKLEAESIDPHDVGDYSAKGAIILARSDPCCSGVLTSSEIEGLRLDSSCELVVLSCCNTARGKITGDGILGLSRSLMCAGVMNMVVTLWPIHDSSTAELMKCFYQHYSTSRDPAAALQAGMMHLIKQNCSMERWAAFCCIGTRYREVWL